MTATEPAEGRPLPRVIAIANQKGGVGKTTTTINLGACLAELGFRTLIIDLDPQGNASTGLGIENRGLETSMYHVIMHEVPLENCIEPSSVKNLFVAPASLDLAGAEIELVPAFSRENRLRKAIDAVLDDYDYVLIDCPPSLGLLTVNGLNAADEVLVPIQCEYYALEGLGQLLRNVDLVKRNLNPTLEVSTIVCVMYDARTKLADQVVNEVREHFGDKVCRTVVPRTVRLSEAPSFGQPIITFDPTSRGAVGYRSVAKEVSRWLDSAVSVRGSARSFPSEAGSGRRAMHLGSSTCPIDSIVPNPHQPRVHFDEESLAELAASIREIGVLQPVLVRPIGDARLRADRRRAPLAGGTSCRPGGRSRRSCATPTISARRAGAGREPPPPGPDPAGGGGGLSAADRGLRLTHEQVANRVGKSRSAVTNTLAADVAAAGDPAPARRWTAVGRPCPGACSARPTARSRSSSPARPPPRTGRCGCSKTWSASVASRPRR